MPETLAPPRRPAAAPPPGARPADLDPDDPPAVLPRMTREEYLAFDDAVTSDAVKYEWFHGEVRKMTGGTENHADVAANFIAVFSRELLAARRSGGRAVRACGSDLRTRIPDGPYCYPDVLVKPIPAMFEESPGKPRRTLLNPVLIVEVLSRSTARVDRGEKRREYLRIPTLENYLIVQPNVRDVIRLTRAGAGWGEKTFRDADVDLPRFGVTLPVEDVYEDCLPGGDRF